MFTLAKTMGGLILLLGISMTSLQAQSVRTEVLTSALENPWALAFLPDGRFLVTERPGRLRVIEINGTVGPALGGLPKVATGGQGDEPGQRFSGLQLKNQKMVTSAMSRY